MVYDIYMRGLKIEKLIQKALATKKNLYDVVVQGLATAGEVTQEDMINDAVRLAKAIAFQ